MQVCLKLALEIFLIKLSLFKIILFLYTVEFVLILAMPEYIFKHAKEQNKGTKIRQNLN